MIETVLDLPYLGFDFSSMPYFGTGALIALLGLVALFFEKRLRVKVPFLCLTFSAALWLISYGFLFLSQDEDLFFQIYLCKIAHIGVSFIPGFILLFISSVFQSPKWFKAWASFGMGISVFFCVMNLGTDLWFWDMYHYSWGIYPRYEPFATAFLFFFFSALLSGISVLIYGCKSVPSKRAQKRLRLLLAAFSVSLFAAMDYLPNYGFSLYPFGCLAVFIFVVMVFETMRRYHLSDLSPAFASEQILETMEGIVLVLDMDGMICVANKFACETLGYQKSELIGKPGNEIIKFKEMKEFSDEPPLAYYLQKHVQTPIRSYSMRWFKKDGSGIDLSVSASILRSRQSSKTEGVVYVALDLTERMKAEQELRSIQDRFQLVADNAREFAFFILDAEGKVETWNFGAERLKLYKADEVIGKHFSCFYLPEDVRAGKPAAALSFVLEHGSMESEGWRVRKDGSKFWANVTLTALKKRDGKLQGFLKITRDVTHRKLLEEENARNQEKMREAERVLREKKDIEMKSNFISMVSHELRTPLTSIKMSVDILKDQEAGPLNPQQMEWVEMCLRNISRLTRLINRVLDFQKMESGRLVYDFRAGDLNEVIREQEKQTRLLLSGKKVELKIDLAPGVLQIKMDRDKITEVLTNILDNAAKFTSSGRIAIRTEEKDGKVLLSIADTGIGIKPDDVPKLFSSFTQVHGAEHKTGGTGLGLAISKKIIEQHDGRIWVESEPGKGTVFYIELFLLRKGS